MDLALDVDGWNIFLLQQSLTQSEGLVKENVEASSLVCFWAQGQHLWSALRDISRLLFFDMADWMSMMLIKTQFFYIKACPMIRQAGCAASTEHGNAPEVRSFPNTFSCVTLLNQHTINGHVTGGTCLCFISAGDCILKHLRTLLNFIMDMLSKMLL